MKAYLIAAAAAALAGACTTPMNEDMGPPPADSAGLPTSAPTYVQMASSSDMFEIESSRLAMQVSRNPAVRSFADMLVGDHSRMSSEMSAVARDMRLGTPPMQMAPHHAEMLERLRTVAPMDFDMAYKREQIAAHQEALTLHQGYAQGGDAAPLRALAARAVPAIEMHLAEAQRLPEYTAPVAAPPPPASYTPEPSVRRRGERG